MRWYVVHVGRETGVFSTWEAAHAQVDGFKGACYQRYNSRDEAMQAFYGRKHIKEETRSRALDPCRGLFMAAQDDEACSAITHRKKRALLSKRCRFVSIYDYEMVEEIGVGTYGVVAKAQNIRTGATVAIKWIRRAKGHDEDDEPIAHAFTLEARCLAAHRDHPGVDVARDAMRQLFGAVKNPHTAGTIHNDINPGNILIGRDGTLKICGFGCATSARPPFAGKVNKVKRLGTLQYRGPKDDIWALGCVMAELITGEPLITAATEEDALDAAVDVRDDIVTMEEEAFGGLLGDLSLPGHQLLAGLLAFHSCERLTAADALKHRWFTEDGELAVEPPVTVEAVVEPLLSGSQESIE
ncbi:hypothetical protein HU200_014774 [Digitaria exilis]|uniref:Protein kinase domain-containing protein n=1 Tax=Digitaria exilis TaxID=1010633 RepID=A0A835FBH8_9POAL|nr:hypothetical protein HU200_014774 [Digitaria exilis]CAB3493719.1 unnamed protein product [Digitaria exilis]